MTVPVRFWLGVALAGALASACGSDDTLPPPASSAGSANGGRSGSVNGPVDRAGETSTSAGAGDAPAQGGAGDTPPIGTIGGDFPAAENGGAPPNPTPTCDLTAKWGAPVGLAGLNSAADEQLLAMTHDELSLVLSRGDALFVADRADAAADFAAPVAVSLPAAYTFAHGLALSDDGLTLVLVSQDQLKLAEVTRSARGKTFGTAANTTRFAWVNANLTQSGLLSSPVLSADGKGLVLTRLESADMTAFWVRGAKLDEATALDAVTLGAVDGKHKLTQSLSADLRTLFFFDEAVGHSAALQSTTPLAAFTERIELSGLLSAFSNSACSRLYGTREVDGSLDVVVETPH
jgi:hypothetical protein